MVGLWHWAYDMKPQELGLHAQPAFLSTRFQHKPPFAKNN